MGKRALLYTRLKTVRAVHLFNTYVYTLAKKKRSTELSVSTSSTGEVRAASILKQTIFRLVNSLLHPKQNGSFIQKLCRRLSISIKNCFDVVVFL